MLIALRFAISSPHNGFHAAVGPSWSGLKAGVAQRLENESWVEEEFMGTQSRHPGEVNVGITLG
jgi:hypothetical protein